jgi:hypothetical protein
MSEAVEPTTSLCDKLLDYVYGELAGDELEQFKLHLLTCEKCKRELAGLERVRSAVKSAMPAVEPPVDKMAQLMHQAAAQKPKRGKVLMFARRVVTHPAMAAAAVFVVVGTAVLVNFSMGKVMMPAPEAVHEEVPVAQPAAAPTLPAPANPMNPIEEKAAPAKAMDAPKLEAAKPTERDKAPEPKIVLKTEPNTYTVRREAKKENADDLQMLQPRFGDAEGGSANGKVALSTGAGAGESARHHATTQKNDRADSTAGKDISGGLMDGFATKSVGTKSAEAKPAAPPPPPAPKPAKTAPSLDESTTLAKEDRAKQSTSRSQGPQQQYQAPPAAPPQEKAPMGQVAGQVAQNQAAPQQSGGYANQAPGRGAPATAAAPAPMAEAESPALTPTRKGASLDNSNADYKQQKSNSPALKKKAIELAQNGRCDEARKLVEQLDREDPGYLTLKDRTELDRCTRIDSNNQQRMATEEQNKVSAPHAAKKAAPAAKAKSKAASSSAPADADVKK